MEKNLMLRKQFLKNIGIGSLVFNVNHKEVFAKIPAEKLKIGLASYTLREYSLDDTIMYCKKLDIKHLALKSFHLPLDASNDTITAVAKKVREAGIDLYGAGVIYMKNEAEVRNSFRYARQAQL